MVLLLALGALIMQLVWGVLAVRQEPDAKGIRRHGALVPSAMASVLPLMTVLLFIRVFVIGRSSNVAQFAGDSGFDLWRLWFHAWPLLFFGNPLAFLVAVVGLLRRPHPPTHWQSFASRACCLIAAGCAWYIVVSYSPDA